MRQCKFLPILDASLSYIEAHFSNLDIYQPYTCCTPLATVLSMLSKSKALSRFLNRLKSMAQLHQMEKIRLFQGSFIRSNFTQVDRVLISSNAFACVDTDVQRSCRDSTLGSGSNRSLESRTTTLLFHHRRFTRSVRYFVEQHHLIDLIPTNKEVADQEQNCRIGQACTSEPYSRHMEVSSMGPRRWGICADPSLNCSLISAFQVNSGT